MTENPNHRPAERSRRLIEQAKRDVNASSTDPKHEAYIVESYRRSLGSGPSNSAPSVCQIAPVAIFSADVNSTANKIWFYIGVGGQVIGKSHVSQLNCSAAVSCSQERIR